MHIVNARLSPSVSMTVTESAARLLSDFRVKENDILIGRRGEMGRCAVVSNSQIGWVCGTGSMIIRCSAAMEPAFLQRVLSSQRAVAAIESASVGSTMINLNQGALSALIVQIPPPREQRAIAATLSDVDLLLDALNQLAAKKRHLKQAVMQQLLSGQSRLPGFSGKWDDVVLGETVLKIGSGVTPTGGSTVYTHSGRPFLRSQNIGWGKLTLDDVVYISDDIHGLFSGTEIQMGDVFLNITGASIGRSGVADLRVVGGNVNQHVCIIRPAPALLDSRYLNRFLLSEFGQRQIAVRRRSARLRAPRRPERRRQPQHHRGPARALPLVVPGLREECAKTARTSSAATIAESREGRRQHQPLPLRPQPASTSCCATA
jgi:type I restriction enzyme S subunit